MRKFLTFAGFVISGVLLVVTFVILCAINLVVNGYREECGMWQNAVPFACTPVKTAKPSGVRLNQRRAPAPKPSAVPARAAPVAPAPRPIRADNGRCAPLQVEPYTVQCDKETGHCFYDIGVRANCGIVHGSGY